MKKLFLIGALALGLGFTACENLEDELADANTTIENLQGDLSEARADLAEANATIAANAAELAELSASLVSVREMLASSAADLLSLEGASAEQIAGLQSQLAALAAEQAAELAELAEARAALASANADQAAALEARIAELIANSEALAAQLAELRANPIMVEVIRVQRILADAIYTDYEPAFTDQIASFEQSRTITINAAGGESLSGTQTRTLEVTNSVTPESVTTYNGLASEAEAIAAIESDASVAVGDVVEISVSITTTETTTYSAEGYDSFDVVGSPSTTAGTAISYTKLGDPADTLSDFGPWTAVETPDSQEFLNEERTRTVVTVNGIADAGLVLVETRNDVTANPNYQAPTDPADVAGAWSYSYVGGSDANWAAGEIDLAGNTLVESISGVRTRVWTINGERDASTPSNLNASNQEVEHKQIRNTSYVAPNGPDTGAWVANAAGDALVWTITEVDAADANPPAPIAPVAADIPNGKQLVAGDDFADGNVALEDYVAPFASRDVTESITTIFGLKGVLFNGSLLSADDISFVASQAASFGTAAVDGSVTFTAAAPGTYTIAYYLDAVQLGQDAAVTAGTLTGGPFYETVDVVVE